LELRLPSHFTALFLPSHLSIYAVAGTVLAAALVDWLISSRQATNLRSRGPLVRSRQGKWRSIVSTSAREKSVSD
jgi:hypothetical protein